MSPIVSVIIPTHDRAALLPRAMASVLRQSLDDLELIVVDDGSCDDTRGVVAAVADPRVRYFYQEHAGANPARNLGARESSGRFVVFLDSDDEALPEWLVKLTSAIEDEEVAVAFCGAERVDAAGVRQEVRNPIPLGPLWNGWTGLFNDGTFLLRREVFDAVGAYDRDLTSSQHSELGFRVVDHCAKLGYRYVCVDEPLVRYHIHLGQRIRTDAAAVLQGTEYILDRYRDRLKRHRGDYYDYLSIAGSQATRLGRHRLARSYFRRALLHCPFRAKAYIRWAAAGLRAVLESRRSGPATRNEEPYLGPPTE